MGGILNGLSLHGGAIPIGGTFFVFSDYMRGSVRLAALSQAKVIYFWTHDSVGLGEDGPTHQPIEQLAAMRAMPGLRVIRPADANESAHALRVAIERDGPTALILTRQNLPVLAGTDDRWRPSSSEGAYVLVDGGDDPDLVLIGTGSEVAVCVAAAELLAAEGITARVVSMPSWELFDEQDDDYQDAVLGPGAPVLSVEAAASFGWARWADDSGRHRPLRRLGAGRGGAGGVRLHRRERGRPGPGPAGGARRLRLMTTTTGEADAMTRLHDLYNERGPEPLDRQPDPALRSGAGDLQKLVDEGIRGVTSNPTIFEKAMTGSDAYDEQFAAPDQPAVGRGRPSGRWPSTT